MYYIKLMATQRRIEKYASLLKEEISQILREELRDPRIAGMISIIDVQVTKDLKLVKVWVSIYGERRDREEIMKGLESSSGYVKHLLSKRLSSRTVPDVRFIFTDALEKGSKIYKKLEELQEEINKFESEKGEKYGNESNEKE